MSYLKIEQRSTEWWQYKVGRVSGTRFGKLISGRDNGLAYEIVNELLDGHITPDDFENEAMQFGVENEPVAIDEYESVSGLNFIRGGVLQSERYPSLHMASPDGIIQDGRIVVEVKCTMDGNRQIQRFVEGPEKSYLPQIINYFAVSDNVEEVHWVSYCPFRPERPLVVRVFRRDTIIESKETKSRGLEVVTVQDKVDFGLQQLAGLQNDIEIVKDNFVTLEF